MNSAELNLTILAIKHSLQLVVPQHEQQRHNRRHVPEHAHREYLGDGKSHPYPHGDGTSEFHHGHGRYYSQNRQIRYAERPKVVGDLLPDVQVLNGFSRGCCRLGGMSRRVGDCCYSAQDYSEGEGGFGEGSEGARLAMPSGDGRRLAEVDARGVIGIVAGDTLQRHGSNETSANACLKANMNDIQYG